MAISYASTINSLYLAYYGRPADTAGLDYWLQQLEHANGDFSGIIDAFAKSEEATAHFHSNDAAEHITQIYQQLFNRAPDAAGLAYWTDLVSSGRVTLANAAFDILHGAIDTDKQLSTLRQQVADSFTEQVRSGGTDYSGYASIEAASVLVKAITLDMSPSDIDTVTKAALKLADIATNTPAVIDAIATGTTLTALLDTVRGAADPVGLVQTLANVAEVAAGNPATLESLLRGGGMEKVLTVMPASATLQDVVHALEQGGLPAAVEVVYPSTPIIVPEPTFNVSLSGGELTISGTSYDAVVVNLTTNTITRAGTPVVLSDNSVDLTDALATGYAGKVTIVGTAAEVTHAMATPSGVSAYDIVDAKSAIFTGEPGARTFVSDAVAQLVDGAHSLKITDVLSAEERSLLDNLQHFNMNALNATVDGVAPAAGELSFTDLSITGTGHAAGITNDGSFGLKLAGAEEGATVKYQVSLGSSGVWATVGSTEGLDSGTYHYRAVVTDAAGNIGTSNVIDITVDKTVPVITGFALGENDGKLAIGESISFSVTFSKVVDVNGIPEVALNNGGTATYTSGAGSDTLVFTYTPQAGQSIESLATAIEHAFSGQIVDQVGNAVVTTNFDNLHPFQQLLVDGEVPTTIITIDAVQQDKGDSPDVADDFVTNQGNATIHATLSAPIASDERVEYSTDGTTWHNASVDGLNVSIADVDATTSPTLSLRVVDAAGNATEAVTQAITFDNEAPVNGVTFNNISEDQGDSPDANADFVTNQSYATVHATLDAALDKGDYVQFSVDGGKSWIDASSSLIQTLSIEGVRGTVDGTDLTIRGIDMANTNSISVRVVDAAGNATEATSQSLSYDADAPLTTVSFNAISEDTGNSQDVKADFITNVSTADISATLSAALADGEYVQYSVDGINWSLVGDKHVSVDGNTVTIAGVDVTGSPTVSVRVVDAAGNAGTAATQHVTYDATAPSTTVSFTSVTEDQADSKDTQADFTTNQGNVSVNATLSTALVDGEYVQYSLDGQTWTTASVDGLNVSIADVDATTSPTLSLRVVDAAGNATEAVTQAITFDNEAPVNGVTFNNISEDQGDSPDANADFVTNQSYATVHATLDAALDKGDYVQFSVDGGKSWIDASSSLIQTLSIEGVRGTVDGTDLTIRGIDMANTNSISVRVVDAAGNATEAGSKELSYDTTAPTTTASITAVGEDVGNSPDVKADLVTNQATADVTATLSAALAPGEYVQYSTNGTNWSPVGDSHVSVNGTTVTIAGVDVTGGPTVSVRVVDAAGNAGTFLGESIVYDHDAPTQTLTIVEITEDTGNSPDTKADFTTNQEVADVKIKLPAPLGVGDYVQYTLDGETWHTVAAPQVDTVGASAPTMSIMSPIDYTITIGGISTVNNPLLQVRVVDAAGNEGATAEMPIKYDGTAPDNGVSIDSISHDEGSSPDTAPKDFVTNVQYATVHASLDAALGNGDYVQFSVDGTNWINAGVNNPSLIQTLNFSGPSATVNGTDIAIHGLDLAETSQVQVRVVDAAGNANDGASQAITFDDVAPTTTANFVSITQDTGAGSPDTVDDFTTNQSVVSISASLTAALADGEYVQYSLDGESWHTVGENQQGFLPSVSSSLDGTTVTIDNVSTDDVKSVSLRVVDAAGNEGDTTSQPITYDHTAPGQAITISSISQDIGDSPDTNMADFTTNQRLADVKLALSAPLSEDEHVQYSVDGGKSWTSENLTVNENSIVIGNTEPETIFDAATATWIANPLFGMGGSMSVTGSVTINGIDTTTNPLLQVRLVDDAGNEGASVEKQITYDGAAPDNGVSIDSISHDEGSSPDTAPKDFVTNVQYATVHASLDTALSNGDYVQFSVDGINWIDAGVNNPSLIQTLDFSGPSATVNGTDVTIRGLDLSETSQVQVRVVDAAGNANDGASQDITFDDVAPTTTATFVSITQDSDAGSPDTVDDFTTNQPVVSITASLSAALVEGEYVQYSLDGQTWHNVGENQQGFLPSVSSSLDGTTVTIDNVGTAGVESVSLRVVDAAGNEGETKVQEITYDHTAPSQTITIGSISQDTGDSPDTVADFTTNKEKADVEVKLSAPLGNGEHVQYSVDGGQTWTSENLTVNENSVVIGNTEPETIFDAATATWIANPLFGMGGSMTVTGSVTIHDLDTTANPLLQVRLVDDAGNESASVEQAIKYDGTAPNVGTIAFSQVTQGIKDTKLDNVTNTEGSSGKTGHAHVDFVYSGEGLASGDKYQWSTDGTNWSDAGIDVFTNTKTVRVKDVDLTHGTTIADSANLSTTVYLRAVDQAGNASGVVSKPIVYDFSIANVTLKLDTDSKGDNIGAADDHITNVATYKLEGIEAGAKVEYSLNGETGWTGSAPATQDGQNTFYVRQTDKAGNVSTSKIDFTYDHTNPGTPTITLESDTGASDGVTNSGKVKIGGLDTDGSTIWEYSLDSGKTWKLGGTADEAGQGEFDLGLTENDGALTVLVHQVDKAGNTSANSAELQFTLDTKAPDNGLSFSAVEQATDTANVTELESARVYFKYTGELDQSARLEWHFTDGSESDLAWKVVGEDEIDTDTHTIIVGPIDLSHADRTVELRQIDAAGNVNEHLVTQFIDGPYHPTIVTTTYDAAGVYVHSSDAGNVVLAGGALPMFPLGPIASNGDLSIDAGSLPLLLSTNSVIGVTSQYGTFLDTTGNNYTLGSEAMEGLYGKYVWGFGGNDVLNGDEVDDFLSGGSGDDHIIGGAGADILNGGTGADTFVFGSAIDSVASFNSDQGYDVIQDFDASSDMLSFQNGFIRNASQGVTIDTTAHATLDDFIQAAQQYLSNNEVYGSVIVGQVGKDVYILGDNATSATAAYEAGADTIIKLENVQVEQIDLSKFLGITGKTHYVGDLTVIDGITTPHPIMSSNITQVAYANTQGGYTSVGSAGNMVAIPGANIDAVTQGGNDFVIYDTPASSHLVAGSETKLDSVDQMKVLANGTPLTMDFDVSVTAAKAVSGSLTDGQSYKSNDQLLTQLNQSYQEGYAAGTKNAAVLVNDTVSKVAMLAVDANGDGVIDSNDYVVRFDKVGTVSVDQHGDVAFAAALESVPMMLPPAASWNGIFIPMVYPNAQVYVGGKPVVGQVTGTMTNIFGEQSAVVSGEVTLVDPVQGKQYYDPIHVVYTLGTADGEVLQGSKVWGFGGNDTLTGGVASSNLYGGNGDDVINGLSGADYIYGGLGADQIHLSAGGHNVLTYMNGETAIGAFVDGQSTANMDIISGASFGDMFQIPLSGSSLQVGQTSYLTDLTSDHFAIVRGTDEGGAFTASTSANADDYMVQWSDGVGINSVVLHDFGTAAPTFSVQGGGMTLVEAPPAPTVSTISSFDFVNNGVVLWTASDEIVNKIVHTESFSAVSATTSQNVGGSFAGNTLYVGDGLSIDVTHVSWQGDTLQTSGGDAVTAGDFYYAGGSEYWTAAPGSSMQYWINVTGFTVNAPQSMTETSYSDENDVSSNDMIVSQPLMESVIHTGGGHDVVDLNTQTDVTLQYDAIDHKAADLLIGFNEMASFELGGELALSVDLDQNGSLSWVRTFANEKLATGNFECAFVDLKNGLVFGGISLDDRAYTAEALNQEIDLSGEAQGHSMLIVANGNNDGALYLYKDSDGNHQIDANELTTIAVYTGDILTIDQITLVGTQVNSGTGIPGGDAP